MNEIKKQRFIAHMYKNEDEDWAHHSHWAFSKLGVVITPTECCDMFHESMRDSWKGISEVTESISGSSKGLNDVFKKWNTKSIPVQTT